MKVKDFLENLNGSILDKIDDLSLKLNKEREFKPYKDFEDIVYGISRDLIPSYIKPIIKELPSKFTMGSKI